MTHEQKTNPKKSAWQRLLLSFLAVLVLHGLFLFVIHIKTLRLPPKPLKTTEDEETLTIWAMSEDDRLLTEEASDMLAWTAMKEADTPSFTKLTVFDPLTALSGNTKITHPQMPASLRLDWSEVTTELDSFLTVTTPNQLASFCVLSLLASNGPRARQYDLVANSLEIPLDIGRQSAFHVPKSGLPRLTPWPQSPAVIVSKYEDSAWESVPADELTKEGASILAELPKDKAPQEWTAPYEVRLHVSTGGQRVARIHLRQSSGIPALDDAVMAWVQKRHATSGHHHTDTQLKTQEHRVDYVVEFTRVQKP